MSTDTTQLLAEIPLFSAMDDEERGQLRAIMKERSFQPGQVVMAASDSEGCFHIIEQGEMEVWLTDTDGKKVVLEVLGPGKVFGNLFMLSDKNTFGKRHHLWRTDHTRIRQGSVLRLFAQAT